MNRVLACILLSIGTVLVIYGLNTLDSLPSALARIMRGDPTDLAFWLLAAGVVMLAAGLAGLFRRRRVHRFALRR